MSLPHTLFAVVLLALSGILAWYQWKSSPGAGEDVSDDEREFFADQATRRMRIAGLLAVVGIAIFVGAWLTSPVWAGLYWFAVIGAVIAVGVLGVLDFRAAQHHLYREIEQLQVDRTEFAAEIARQERDRRRREERSGNGAH